MRATMSMPAFPLVATLPFRHEWAFWLFYLAVAWGLTWGGSWVARARAPHLANDWPWYRTLGIVLMVWPFVKLAYGVYVTFGFVMDTSSVKATVPAAAWWATIERRWWQYVLVPMTGLFLAAAPFARGDLGRSAIAARWRRTLVSIQGWPRHSLLRDVVNGIGLFVVIYIGYLLMMWALSPLRRFDTGDESGVFYALGPGLAFALSLTAGVTEELLFRGILQTRLRRLMPLAGAIAVQSLFFGLIHSGYGTIGHILMPALFGAVMGVVTARYGLIPAILVHALIDLAIFLDIAAGNGHATAQVLDAGLWIIALAAPVLYWSYAWWQRRQTPEPTAERLPAEMTSES